jgi:hypothetical protein
VIQRLSLAAGAIILMILPTQLLQGQTGARANQIVTFSVLAPRHVDLAGTLLLRDSPPLTMNASSKITIGWPSADTLRVDVPHRTILPAGGTTPETHLSMRPPRKPTVYTITE